MVHALMEVWRVLRPGGSMVDLRPAALHAAVGLVHGGRFTNRWKTAESLEGYRAASRSIAAVRRSGLFRPGYFGRFTCTFLFPAIEDLKGWLYNWYETEITTHADRLVELIGDSLALPSPAGTITAEVPFILKVYNKMDQGA